MQISKDINGTREKIRWENEEGKWMPVVVVEVKDKPAGNEPDSKV